MKFNTIQVCSTISLIYLYIHLQIQRINRMRKLMVNQRDEMKSIRDYTIFFNFIHFVNLLRVIF